MADWLNPNTGTYGAGGPAPQGGFDWGQFAGTMANSMGGMGANKGGDFDPWGKYSEIAGEVPGIAEGYYQPWTDAGKGALSQYQGQIGQLLSDPSGFLSKIGESYKSSPGYQFNVDEATGAANRAAAAGGMLGSPMEQQQLAQRVSGIASQDYNNYMQDALRMYGMGFGGSGQLQGQGFQAAGSLADIAAQVRMAQAKAAQEAELDKRNQAAAQGNSGIGKLIGTGIGYAVGGPAGGSIGGSLGNAGENFFF